MDGWNRNTLIALKTIFVKINIKTQDPDYSMYVHRKIIVCWTAMRLQKKKRLLLFSYDVEENN